MGYKVIKLVLIFGAVALSNSALAGVVGSAKPIDQAYSFSTVLETSSGVKATGKPEPKTISSRWSSFKKNLVDQVNQWRAPVENKMVREEPLTISNKETIVSDRAEAVESQNEAKTPALSENVMVLSGEAISDSVKKVDSLKKKIGAVPVFTAVSKGRLGQVDLPKSKSGIPKYEFKNIKVSNIPDLDIGEEGLISRESLTGEELSMVEAKYGVAKKLNGPDSIKRKTIRKWLKRKIRVAKGTRKLKQAKFGLGEVVSHRKIDKVDLTLAKSIDLPLKVVRKFKKQDINMLGAMILYQKADRCHVVIGLFADLLKHPSYGNEAEFYLGACAHKMGFFSEAVIRLTNVIKREDTQYTSKAASLLMKEVPKEYNERIAKSILNIKNKKLIATDQIQKAIYYLAQANFKKGMYKSARTLASKIVSGSKSYSSALYLSGISNYALGKTKSAEVTLKKVQGYLVEKGVAGTQLNSLVAISLGRIQFNKGKYQEALKQYISIKKDHPLWIEGLVEQGWTQLQLGDYSGAIGNMYSLHSPYFKSVFMPESHVIRTIGYLNICQFGDAYRTLSRLEDEHRQWYSSIDKYIKKTKLARQYYETVKTYLRGKSQNNVDGLPHQVIREISRQKEFLNIQQSMNEKEDELNQYNFINAMVKKDKVKIRVRMKKAETRAKVLKKKMALAKGNKNLVRNLNEWNGFYNNERNIARALRFELALYERGRQGYLSLKRVTEKRFKKEKYLLGEKVGRGLVRSLYRARGTIKDILDNNEYLRYEIFAGSGENIRYQVAGGSSKAANRLPASIKPSKSLNWDFAGEYWADEIGSYRSSLINNCPSIMGNENRKLKYKDGSQSKTLFDSDKEKS